MSALVSNKFHSRFFWGDSFIFSEAPIYSLCFRYTGTPFDKKGFIYWLGTRNGEFVNPTKLNIGVVCSRSSNNTGTADDVLSYKPVSQWTSNKENSYWKVDFGKYAIMPDYYSRTYSGSGLLRNWKLQGSNDDCIFDDLVVHNNDTGLSKSDSVFSWPVLNAKNIIELSEFYKLGSIAAKITI